MADVKVKIIYPKEGSHVPPGRVFVFGTADPKDAAVAGTVTPHDGSAAADSKPVPKVQVPPAYDWGISFVGVLPKMIQRLEVVGSRTGFTDGKAIHHFHARHAALNVTITIDSPPSGGTVSPDFVAAGYVDPTTSSIMAWVQKSGQPQQTKQGVRIFPTPSPYDWAVQFHGVDVGDWVLMVQALGGGGTTTVAWNITVA